MLRVDGFQLFKLAAYLFNNIVEKGSRVLGLNLLLDPPVGSEVRDVGLAGRACAASQDSDNTAIPSQYDRPGVASIGELAAASVRGHDGDFNRGLADAVFRIAAGEGFQAIDATGSSSRGQPILDDVQTILAILVEMLRVADLAVLDDAVCLQKTVTGVLEGRLISRVREH